MADINRMVLMGRLGADPVLRQTKNGIPVATFHLATESYVKSRNETETTWHRIVTWGKPAQRCSEELKKGMPLFLEGKMKVRKWETHDGQVSYFHEVHVENLKFLHRKAREESIEQTEETSDDVLDQLVNH